MTLSMKAGRGLPVKFVYKTDSMTAEWTIHADDDETMILVKLKSMMEFVNSFESDGIEMIAPPTIPSAISMDPPAVPNGWELLGKDDG